MKVFVVVAATCLLSSCASDGQLRTSTSFNGQSFHSMDMTDPHFYMDDDAGPTPGSGGRVPTAPHYGIDGYCGYCQSRGNWAN